MSDDVLVRVDNVSKRFCRSLKRSLWYGLQDLGSEIGGRRHGGGSGLPQSSADVQLRPDEFWAVKDVSFELRRGECLGLIGRNGAGKTTLLRMLNGLIKPDAGEITTKGRACAVIALGSGFNPVLSGRENIYTNGAILGLTKAEINVIIDDIIDFSGVKEFIDSPIQSYSSGMAVRLGFAVATAMNPDVLILDEVLAVGDAQFRAKCYMRIAKIQKKAAIIFVSHSMETVGQTCDIGAFLSGGILRFLGNKAEAIQRYEEENHIDKHNATIFQKNEHPIKACDVKISTTLIKIGEEVEYFLDINTCMATDLLCLRLVFYDSNGSQVSEWNSLVNNQPITLSAGINKICIKLPVHLRAGTYFLSTCLSPAQGIGMLVWWHKTHTLTVQSTNYGFAAYQMQTSTALDSFRILNQ
jgi:lipopolysaccharide transport system ATP-binding protein